MAVAFAREGADVVVNYVSDSAAAEAVIAQVQALGRAGCAVRADVADRGQAEALVGTALETLGGLDILVNNAGLSLPGMLLNLSEEDWDRVVSVHLKGTFNCTQPAARHMAARGAGRIINVISTAGLYGTVGQINYASAKAGIIGFTKSAARELGKHNITVNALCPGVTLTDMTEKIRTDERFRDTFLRRIQLRRFAEPEELAPAFVFLASQDAAYVTAQVLGVDGGYIG